MDHKHASRGRSLAKAVIVDLRDWNVEAPEQRFDRIHHRGRPVQDDREERAGEDHRDREQPAIFDFRFSTFDFHVSRRRDWLCNRAQG